MYPVFEAKKDCIRVNAGDTSTGRGPEKQKGDKIPYLAPASTEHHAFTGNSSPVIQVYDDLIFSPQKMVGAIGPWIGCSIRDPVGPDRIPVYVSEYNIVDFRIKWMQFVAVL